MDAEQTDLGFDLLEGDGPEHNREFTMTAGMNNELDPDGLGKNEEEAKQNAVKDDLSFLEICELLKIESNSKSSSGVSDSSSLTTEEVALTIARFFNEFDSITRIGKGGYGWVFKARQKVEDRYFAVKRVKLKRNAQREVDTLSRLEHANIVQYHGAWIEKTAPADISPQDFSSSSSNSETVELAYLYIQMELCEEDTLREWIEERNHHPEKYPERRQEAAKIIKQVLEAVKYIHSQNLIHRDLKPSNIMFGIEGGVKVGDFGLVTEEEGDDDGILLERTKSAGTPSYMSPEHRDQLTYGRKVDIFPVGLIYFELLWLIGTQNEKQRIWDNFRSRILFPEEFSEMFPFEHKLIKRMLHEYPERRPEASELLRELDQHLATTTDHTDG